ncbi:pyridoxamine 5'-phosphate oxidase [Streptomyces sp. SCA3-4]|uniref:pyridoxamine 5'-phosphate oxidase n=1 Tax=Streptomyces sichuanensis TaxID=2871810 RepID=UPI001CE2CEE5|nr:pyridoxamine 5'-phosphate oxidase [Streptomyces sichuanensis]MCA6092352.1 pyridoxamine 5'-phosphate oxidase [Streptomyces sichuanensis]
MTPTETLPPQIRAALDAHTTLTLAYADEDGPQACAVLYAVADRQPEAGRQSEAGRQPDARATTHEPEPEPEPVLVPLPVPVLVFVTSTGTRHGRALLSGDARVAFTAQRDGQQWTALTGVQGRGACRLLDGAERAAAWRAYSARFPYVEESERLRQAMERAELWELRPTWLRLVDNGRGFGHKTEWPRPLSA